MAKKLTVADEKCIKLHTVDGLTQTEAFRQANAKRVARWKSETIHVKASVFFSQDKVRVRMAELIEKAQKDTEIDHAYVLKRFNELENFDFLDVFDPDTGNMKPLKDWPLSARRTIIAIEVDDLYEGKGKDKDWVGTVTKIKIESRSKALESIAKHLKFYPDAKVNVNMDEDTLTLLDRVQNASAGSPQGMINDRKHVN